MYRRDVGNYTRLLNDPDLADEHHRLEVLARWAHEVADTLPPRQSAVVHGVADALTSLHADHAAEVEECLEQTAIINRLSSVVDVAAGYISSLPHHDHRSPHETRRWLEEAERG